MHQITMISTVVILVDIVITRALILYSYCKKPDSQAENNIEIYLRSRSRKIRIMMIENIFLANTFIIQYMGYGWEQKILSGLWKPNM